MQWCKTSSTCNGYGFIPSLDHVPPPIDDSGMHMSRMSHAMECIQHVESELQKDNEAPDKCKNKQK